jgi:hypothetical protein
MEDRKVGRRAGRMVGLVNGGQGILWRKGLGAGGGRARESCPCERRESRERERRALERG